MSAPGADLSDPRYPSLYQINTRVWLTELSRTLGLAPLRRSVTGGSDDEPCNVWTDAGPDQVEIVDYH